MVLKKKMQRNRGKFNQKSRHSLRLAEGNVLTFEQRRLVEKQQEMLRNVSLNQGITPFSAQGIQMQSSFNPISLLSSLGGVLPNLLSANNTITPLMATPVMVPPPPMVPSPIAQVQSSLFGSGISNNSLYNDVQSRYLSEEQSRHLQKNNRREQNNRIWNKPKQLISSQLQNSEFDKSFSSSSRLKERSWTKKSNSNDDESHSLRDRPTHAQNWNSFSKPWNKDKVQGGRSRIEKEKDEKMGGPNDRVWTSKSWNSEGGSTSESGFDNRSGEQVEIENHNIMEDSKWNKDSGDRVWGKRSRESEEKSWRDASKIDQLHKGNWPKKLMTSDNSWINNQNEPGEEAWLKKSSAPDGLSSKYVETEKNWRSSKEQEEKRGNKFDSFEESWQNKRQKSDEGNSWRAKAHDSNDQTHLSKSLGCVDSWSEKTKDFENEFWSKKSIDSGDPRLTSVERNNRDWSSSNMNNNQKDSENAGKRDTVDREEILIGTKGSEKNLSKKDFWKSRKNETPKNSWVPNNYLYPDPGKKLASDVWSRLESGGNLTIGATNMSEEEGIEQSENILLGSKNLLVRDDGWNSLKSVPLMKNLEESNLQMQISYLDSQLGQLDERMLQIHNLASIPGQVTSLPVVWENQNKLFSQGEILNTVTNSNDLRLLLQNKAKGGATVHSPMSDMGGWNENMVLIYPFLKSITMGLSDITDLKTQLSERIHMLLNDKSQDIQPRFFETANVCRNWFMVHCADQQSVDWLLTWKPQVKAKTRMKLCTRKAVDAVKITRVSIVLKGIKESIRDIEVQLIHQNEHLECHMWRRGPHSFSLNDTTVSFLVDAACLRLLEAGSWTVYYELNKFKVNVVEHKPIIPLVYTSQYVNSS